MDRISEIWQKTTGVKLIKQALESLKAKQYIEIRQEIPDQELLAVINEIMPGETPQEAVTNIQSVEIVKGDPRGTEATILKAITDCKANGIKLTVRNVASKAGLSKSTIHNHYDLLINNTE